MTSSRYTVCFRTEPSALNIIENLSIVNPNYFLYLLSILFIVLVFLQAGVKGTLGRLVGVFEVILLALNFLQSLSVDTVCMLVDKR